ncbi:L-proline dehydrogenase [Flagellimonas taeanensis]|uniref:L-proline dehydrogenase n=1 Tax=Flagellimonas taeanensis TaxID=1005926 RepID=A0A1M6RM01_9FLAO|nr:proline dehydrogenase family protein [Allomuricauda taeanensis]SFB76013.1 L-proline dehydrogenase [Allomuricauda taeanensis]SHK33531.1 L-proline dehydrogenase [Allomuricauda taeanensis]
MSDTINFNNTEIAFGTRTKKELLRAKFLFGMLEYGWLTRMAKPLLNIAFKSRLPIDPIIKKTIFSQFCGGESLMECKTKIDALYNGGEIMSILDYSVEGAENETSFDQTLETLLKICEFSEFQKQVPFLVFKPSGLGSLELFEKVSNGSPLDDIEMEKWNKVRNRFEMICESVAKTENLKIMVDAEESWCHTAIDGLTEEMMVKYNTQRTVVFTTVQLYLSKKIDYLRKLKALGEQNRIKIGVKLVRGAYMEKERDRALEHGYESPVCEDKSSTDQNFNNGGNYVLENLDVFDLFLGTHNELSCLQLVKKLKERNISNSDERIWFGQLYGMSDNISYNLAERGYNVAKYVPFGPVRDVMPYLIRRAEENSSVGSQSSREMELIKKELLRRKNSQ